MRFLRENSLSIGFGALFLVALGAQSLVGQHAVNAEAAQHCERAISWGRYVTSSEFGSAVLENWQSEYLQFALFVIATVWFQTFSRPT